MSFPILGLSDKALKELCDSLPPLTDEQKRIIGERLVEGVRRLNAMTPTAEQAGAELRAALRFGASGKER